MRLAGLAGPALAGLIALVALATLPPPAGAQAPNEARWLPPGTALGPALASAPARRLRAEQAGGAMSLTAQLGELAFRSPVPFGRRARQAGLSCQSCHPNGHRNGDFFIPGASARPGSFDVTSGLFARGGDDGIANPIDIPSLRGARSSAPYGRDGRFASLRAFTRNAIVNEFGGPEPAPWLLDALVAYQRELMHLPGPRENAESLPGAALFRATGCARCHVPSQGYRDGRLHDVGTGGLFETPGLVNLADSAPYLHDGRAPDLDSAIAHGTGALAAADRHALTAFVAAIGATAAPRLPVRLDAELARIAGMHELLRDSVSRPSPERTLFIVASLRHELRRLDERYAVVGDESHPARRALRAWSRALKRVRDEHETNGGFAAEVALAPLHAARRAGERQLRAHRTASLFNPDRLTGLRAEARPLDP